MSDDQVAVPPPSPLVELRKLAEASQRQQAMERSLAELWRLLETTPGYDGTPHLELWDEQALGALLDASQPVKP